MKPRTLRDAIERGYAVRGGKDRRLFYDLLLEATLWLAADEHIDHIDDIADLSLVDVRLAAKETSGGAFLLGFSSETEGAAFRAGAHPLIEVRGDYLGQQFSRLTFQGLLLDAGSQSTATVTRQEFLALTAGHDPAAAPPERIVGSELGDDDVVRTRVGVPDEWNRKLAAILGQYPFVTAAYVVGVRVGGLMAPRVIIEFNNHREDCDPSEVMEQLRRLESPFDVMTTDEPKLLGACHYKGRRIF